MDTHDILLQVVSVAEVHLVGEDAKNSKYGGPVLWGCAGFIFATARAETIGEQPHQTDEGGFD